MPQYTYTAKNREGQTINDSGEAESREAMGQILRGQGLLPTQIEEKRAKREFGSIFSMLGRVSLLEKLTFAKNLAVTLKAGLPVSRALVVVTKQMSNPYFSRVIADIAHNVESGKTLSESLGAYPRIFSPIFVNMVKVGETSGELDDTLQYLAKQIGRDYNLIRRTKGAMTYPAVVVVALLIIGYLMFTFVLPKLTASFAEFDTDLPILTRVIITTVDIFSRYSILVGIGLGGLIAGFLFWRKTQSGHIVLHRLVLMLPMFKTLVKKINLARFTIIFTGLLKSGMPIVEALSITSNTMSNIYYQQALADASEKVKIGVDLVSSLERYPHLFTPMVTQMIQVGEESGTMETVLEEVADFYEAEIDDTVKNLSSIIEPILVMVIGAVVGVLAVGLILPIYNISQNI
ncbi:MAG: hypothetical protein A3C85_03280 [Candidatus Doudnabacteria bacterium RIFCSPHIGHO2_02_FULL_48_21]|uniref:Type II secretion system protein GspF domain-containing protein n=1 Tax=Candidatus Doudnabacteria bacterium RIFCSPLOWO2_02_FULL_48_13 TaxID=1817845 RepID=A0A1F5QB05_9BACT|nr:MAG: hypothetical protein A3K05_03840 [Candidatus Doudnabacteria bacterium RIFCSPHIGHO2_01_48_18]OGE77210.1 MAG: hypothetical protein A2668_01780 [Candidatus Doudnabacteria bacterium RIFCSPHIGHO2_01_FULL_48_180]OGE91420.1 MAG: hypothetical protein A3F44_00680 [Candidatus Doudnabacteria bacterium RIFCSPHIGHO2_12_FULL_47_25]OGE93268.1 MAG: hypothetical protein A3C85_03280 [Candidatus Doudnabacteria bacterium RIFCSPHIGHO2_02_FULL_48_21]OGE96799.1 MAG: hypothetical protein A3A83_02015 [Candidatu